MKQSFTKKLAAFVLAVGLLLPFAASTAQAKTAATKEVWILDTKQNGKYVKYKYKYNKNGLLTEEKCLKGDGSSSVKYVYKGKKISKYYQAVRMSASDAGTYKLWYTYTYDKNGRLVKSTWAFDDVTKYTWKNGHITVDDCAYIYNKKGWITAWGMEEAIKNPARKFKYDKYGYVISAEGQEGDVEKHKNIYKDGRLERVYIAYVFDGEEEEIDTDPAIIYKYKKIKVPASYVKQVKRQQEWLTNKGSFQELPLAAY